MATLQKVALVGAAGSLGSEILKALLDAKFDVTVISRAGSKSTFSGVSDEKVVRGDYTLDFFRRALEGQDALVTAVTSSAIDSQRVMIQAAAEAGVKRIVPSEFGSDIDSPESLAAIPFNKAKKVISDYLEEIVANNPKTTWTGVTCGPFFDWCLDYNLWSCNVQTHQATLFDNGKTRFDSTNIATVGKAVARILSMPEKFQNERIFISGIAITQVEILETLQKATAPHQWTVEHRTSDSLRKDGYEKLAKNDHSGIVDIIGASLFQEGTGGNYSANHKLANDVLGVKDDLEQTVAEYVKRVSVQS